MARAKQGQYRDILNEMYFYIETEVTNVIDRIERHDQVPHDPETRGNHVVISNLAYELFNKLMEEIERIDATDIESRDVEKLELTAEEMRKAGWKVEINLRLPTVAVTSPDGQEWFFQEYEASRILDECYDELTTEDSILIDAQYWG